MADIDPFSQIQQYTPRQSDLVDAVAESRRAIDAAIRSNPLRNAVIDDGLMRWRGNYTGGINASYLWIGEIFPVDAVLGKMQRAFVLSRDDNVRARALWMYDPFAESANPVSQPLRQLVSMHDADNYPMVVEGRYGGLRFPHTQIALYPVRNLFGGGPVPYLHAQNQTVVGQVNLLYRGMGSMSGSRIFARGYFATNNASAGVGVHMVCNWTNGATYTSARYDLYGNTASGWEFDIEFSSLKVVGSRVEVLIYGSGIAASDQWTWVVPERCYSFSA